ncbi:hypothetical protein EMPS_05571 [Entomortierella parvispora]|uniref:Uncharacterized protein n=1 Tax=Entomortierella parvispora TaxID=205924 RepID=A0A9P3HB28_9FUNG|nr:hypothetical protein EMPS_05571 [Entomortierella parvispora]
MTVDDSVMQKLWKLTNELTAQLVFNRNATLELKQQLADLQAKTAQGPISITQGVSAYNPQEHADWSLRIANERLQEENAQLQEQLREYERWMEFIMTKFRLQNFAMAQSRKEALHDAYRMAEQEGELAAKLQEENAILQARLVDVGAVARKAISEEYYNTESIIETLEMENQGLREMLGVASDHMNTMAMVNAGNRVSFPSTGSYAASSGSDREPMHPHHEHERGSAAKASSGPISMPPTASAAATTKAAHGSPTSANEAAVSLAKHAAQMSLNVAEGGTVPKANSASVTEMSTSPPEKVTEKSSKPIAGSGAKKKTDAKTGATPAHTSGSLTKDGKGGMTINTTMSGTKKATSNISSNSSSNSNSNSHVSNGTTTSNSTSKTRKPARKTKS